MFSSLFVCLFVSNLVQKNFPTDLHAIFREGWQWANEQMIKFWWRSGYCLDTGIVSRFITVGRYGKWFCCCILVPQMAAVVIIIILFARWRPAGLISRHWQFKTCLGGGMNCSIAFRYKNSSGDEIANGLFTMTSYR